MSLAGTNHSAIARESARIARTLRSWQKEYAGAVNTVAPGNRRSAINLAQYILYRADSARLEGMLDGAGLRSANAPLSVLGDVEYLAALSRGATDRDLNASLRRRKQARALLGRRTTALLGPRIGRRRSRLIVNASGDTAEVSAMAALLSAGVSAIRINCARGDRKEWRNIVTALRGAEKRTGRRCRIFCDLAGPKLRTVSVLRPGSRETDPRVRKGDRFLLVADRRRAGGPLNGVSLRVSLSIPAVLSSLRPGDPLLIDDGKIVCRIMRVGPEWAEAEVAGVREKGRRLRPERSVNLPSTPVHLPSLTAKDEEDLSFAASHADLIGLSFVRDAGHIAEVSGRLREMGAAGCGLVVKVENADAVRNLPLLLFEALKVRRAALLIARGDLAAECGFDSLAAIQRESAALAHAAHLPVILATQVMEQMVQEGMPSRAEVGDIAGAEGMEAFLLNRGKFLPEALRLIDSIVD